LSGPETKTARTDASGAVSFQVRHPGLYTVSVRDPDFVYTKSTIYLRAGESRRLTIDEPEGWTGRILVLDASGTPVPFAAVEVDTSAPVDYIRVRNGIQDLALYTDLHGELELPRLPRGKVSITVEYGSRIAKGTIEPLQPEAVIELPRP